MDGWNALFLLDLLFDLRDLGLLLVEIEGLGSQRTCLVVGLDVELDLFAGQGAYSAAC